MTFGVEYDFSALKHHGKFLDDVARRQLPFAAAKSLTQSAKQAVQDDIPAEMRRVFDRPTKYTQRVLAFLPATKSKLRAEILPRSFAGKGNVAWEYLNPEVTGGARKAKRSEKRLQAVLGEQVFLTPGRGVKLDSSGNISRAQWTKIMSGLGALGDQSATKKSAKRSKRLVASHGGINGSKRRITNSQYFIGRSKKSGKPIAVYQLKRKGKVEPVMLISRKRPTYKARFNFAATVERSIQRSLPRLFEKNLDAAIRTARP